jgi:predicted esterase
VRRLALVLLVLAAPAAAAPKKKPRPPKDYAWCADEVESLGNDTCYIDGRESAGGGSRDRAEGKREGKRTLVIFLHGVIGKHTDWSWTQERALLRQAKAGGFEAIFPRAPDDGVAYAWPGGAAGQAKYEADLIAGWKRAQKQLETKSGTPFDQVFVMGFSSGAYYVSSLALRGRLEVDGYAAFAGGSIGHQHVDKVRKVPVYVGICGADKQTAPHSRGFAGELATRGFPVRAEEHHVGHMFSDPHVARAIDFLRKQNADKPAAARVVD